MDPEVSVLLHCTAWGGLLEPQVQVELSARFNRQTEPALESHIEEVWTERVTMEPWLFNGAKFRLHSFSLASPQPSCPSTPQPPYMTGGDRDGRQCSIQKEEEGHNETKGNADSGRAEVLRHQRGQIDGVIGERQHNDKDLSSYKQREGNLRYAQTSTPGCRDQHPAVGSSAAEAQPFPQRDVGGKGEGPTPILTLRLGLTCYRDFLGTNWSQRARKLRQRAEVEYGDPLALLAQPLGVGGILCTADRQVVLIRRSQQVAEARGLLDIPGGHPEPKAVFEGLDEEDRIRVEMLQWREEAVVRELFSSVCAEIRDEVNVPLCSLGEPVLMGIALNHTSAGRPSAEFYISCSLTSTEVRELYWQGGIEAQESTDIVFLSQTEVLRLDQSTPLWSELCPSAKGAVLLYQLVLPDQEDKSNWTQTPATAPDKISR
ncbi:uridine diphosphate glucose pyrophosphatase NUDT22 [Salvelinus namaycush]|uniref:Uridine diphosphate glucose pyrophosphatase NUDT22 n=1 Tax=Salvelinus namaycush TaxID=8040 RepID=A0A8U1F206_SALNM|nr:uridine diphosphate glucose pyrophosphatase NUDT22 [Salvelinus namaycush]